MFKSIALTAIVVLTGCATVSSPLQLTPITESNRRLEYNGFAVTAPAEGWSFGTPVPRPITTGLQKEGGSQTNTIRATVAVGNMPKVPPDELFKMVAEAKKKESAAGRFRPVRLDFSKQRYRGADCQRADNIVEDRGVPGYSGKLFILEMHGLTCIHPDMPAAIIDIQYSQRRLADEAPMDITKEGEAFIQSLEFLPLVRPFVTNALEVSGSPQMVLPGHGSFWITRMSENSVARIKPDLSGISETVKVGKGPVGLAVTDTAVWVVNLKSDTVSRIDPMSNKVVATVAVGPKPLLAAAGFGSVWVTNSGGKTVSRIDPKTNSVTATVTAGKNPSGISIAKNAVWVTNFGDDTIQRIDPAANRADKPIRVGLGPNFIFAEGDVLWVSNQNDGAVHRIDAATGEMIKRIWIGSTLGGISAGLGFVWVADFGRGKLIRIDPDANGTVDPPIPVGASPLGVAATADAVFVVDVAGILFRIEP